MANSTAEMTQRHDSGSSTIAPIQGVNFIRGLVSTDAGLVSTKRSVTDTVSTDSSLISTDSSLVSTGISLISTESGLASTNRDIIATNSGISSTNNRLASTDSGLLTTKHGTASTNSPLSTSSLSTEGPQAHLLSTAAASGFQHGLVFVIAGAAAVVVLVLIVVLCLIRRRRKNKRGGIQVEPEHLGGSQWHDNSFREPSAAMRDSGFREEELEAVPDIELQPRFSLDLESIDKSVGVDDHPHGDPLTNERTHVDKENVVFDSKSKSFKVSAASSDGESNGDDIRVRNDSPKSTTMPNNSVEHYRKNGEQYTLVSKPSCKTVPKGLSNYDFADPFGVKEPINQNTKQETCDNEEDGVYISMAGDIVDDTYVNNTAVLSYEEEKMYANSIQVKRFLSVIEPQKQFEEHVPKRAVSAAVSRPPKPQPRVSKRKTFDPYDYLPGFSMKNSEFKEADTDIKDKQVHAIPESHRDERSGDDDNVNDAVVVLNIRQENGQDGSNDTQPSSSAILDKL